MTPRGGVCVCATVAIEYNGTVDLLGCQLSFDLSQLWSLMLGSLGVCSTQVIVPGRLS